MKLHQIEYIVSVLLSFMYLFMVKWCTLMGGDCYWFCWFVSLTSVHLSFSSFWMLLESMRACVRLQNIMLQTWGVVMMFDIMIFRRWINRDYLIHSFATKISFVTWVVIEYMCDSKWEPFQVDFLKRKFQFSIPNILSKAFIVI